MSDQGDREPIPEKNLGGGYYYPENRAKKNWLAAIMECVYLRQDLELAMLRKAERENDEWRMEQEEKKKLATKSDSGDGGKKGKKKESKTAAVVGQQQEPSEAKRGLERRLADQNQD